MYMQPRSIDYIDAVVLVLVRKVKRNGHGHGIIVSISPLMGAVSDGDAAGCPLPPLAPHAPPPLYTLQMCMWATQIYEMWKNVHPT